MFERFGLCLGVVVVLLKRLLNVLAWVAGVARASAAGLAGGERERK